MTFQNSYEFMNQMSKMFRLDDNAVKTTSRSASIQQANNIQSNKEQQDKLCAKMISQVIQRTAAITNSNKVDEIGILQSYLARYH